MVKAIGGVRYCIRRYRADFIVANDNNYAVAANDNEYFVAEGEAIAA